MRLAIVITLLLAGPLVAQDLPGDGPEVFAGLLHFRNVRPADDSRVRPGDIVIVFNPRGQDLTGKRLVRRVLAQGGSALLASERATDWTDYLPDGGGAARTTFEKVVAPRPGVSWGGDRQRPLVAPNPDLALPSLLNGLGRRDPLDAVFRNTFRLATDRPSAVVVDVASPSLSGPFAHFPAGSLFDTGNPVQDGSVAVGSTRAGGARLLILADPSMLANDLLTAIDATGLPADNLPFADTLVTWLSDGGARERCHFLVNGERITNFQTVRLDGIPPIPLPDIDPFAPKLQRAMTDLANRSLAKAEADGKLDKLLRGSPQGQPPGWLRTVAVVAVAAVVALLARQLLGSTRPVAASAGPAVARDPADLLPAARDYLAGLVVELGREPTGPVPPLRGPAARTLAPGFRIVWGVASGADPTPVSPRRWAELAGTADALRAAFTAGTCSFRQ